jgi:hypothetical protein
VRVGAQIDVGDTAAEHLYGFGARDVDDVVSAFDQLAEHGGDDLTPSDLAPPDAGVDLGPVRVAPQEQFGAEPGTVGQYDHRSDLAADVEQQRPTVDVGDLLERPVLVIACVTVLVIMTSVVIMVIVLAVMMGMHARPHPTANGTES